AKTNSTCIACHNSDDLQAHDAPISTMALNPLKYHVPAESVAKRSVTVDQYQEDVKAKASQILERNKAIIDDIQKKYKDSEAPAWQSLKKAMAKDQELRRAEYEAHEELGLQEHYYEVAKYHPYDSTSYHDIDQREAELDTAKNSYEKIKSARKLLRTGYPEIVALDVYNQDAKGLFSKRIDREASNEEMGQAMASGFEKIKDDIDESYEKINNDDVPLETLSNVLDEVRKDPKYSELQDEINGWIEGEQSKDKWIKTGAAGLATLAGLGSLAFGGLPGMVLAGIGTGVGAGGAIYNLERSVDLFDIAQSQRVGEQLSQASYEEAKFDMVMGGVDLALSGIDAVSVVKSWKGLSKVTDGSTLMEKGEDAAHLAWAEKPIAKAVEEPKYAEIDAQKANMAENLAKKSENEYVVIRDVDGPKTTSAIKKEDVLTKLNNDIEFRKRTLELAKDPDRKELLIREGIGAARFEQATGRTIIRSTDGATDFVDSKLGSFDLKGPIRANDGSVVDITPKRIEGLGKSVIKEANRSTASKAVVVDTLGLSKEQVSLLKYQVEVGLKTDKPIFYIE
ncbi:MAG: hypothetical protein P8077_08655, partial [Gammaproteobacteria bacterium]